MPFDTLTRYACGDYKPGELPRGTTGNQVPLSKEYVPGLNLPSQIFPPEDGGVPPLTPAGPPSPGPSTPGTPSTPTPTPGGSPTAGGGPTGGPAGGPTTGGRGLTGGATPRGPTTPRGYTGPADVLPGRTGRPPTITGGSGPTTGGPGSPAPAGPRGPVTGGRGVIVDERFVCVSEPIYCEEDVAANLPVAERRIKGTRRGCSPYYPGRSGDRPDQFNTRAQCESQCFSLSMPGNPCVTVTPGTRSIQQQQEQLRQSGTTNATTNYNKMQSVVPQKTPTNVVVNSKNYKGYSSANPDTRGLGAGIFDPYYNFFKTKPVQETSIVGNDLYLNIFKTQVASEVKYFLTKTKNNSPWHEIDIHNLTKEKIATSLRVDLLTALNNIHTIGNSKVSENNFFEVIKKHLMEGTLDEFDPNYYFYIYNNQLVDKLYEFDETGETRNTIDASLAIFESNSKNPDYTKISSPEEVDEFKRFRFLLEDIEAEIPVVQLEGYDYPISLNNVGVPTQQLPDTISFLPNNASGEELRIGDGAGYYFSTLNYDGSEYPLPTDNQLSDARYLQANERYNILKLLNRQGSLNITASSLEGVHEFSSSYNPSADVEVMYFALNLKSVGDIPNPNSVVNILSATYSRLTFDDAVAHSRNYSFNVVKANVDYRDPFIHYARDSSSLYLEQDDFDLRAFDYNRSIKSLSIMTRTLPAAIILTPGCGSYHNPYNSRSTLQNFKESVIKRTINFIPSINVSDDDISKPLLDKDRIHYELDQSYHGLYEKYLNSDVHGFIYKYNPSGPWFNRSYYVSGGYSNVQPPSSLRTQSTESKFVALVDKLTSVEGVSELTWWDVFRRLRLDDVGSLMYTNHKPIIKDLSLGKSNETPIKLVLSRYNIVNSGIPDGATIADDNIIINVENRYNRD